MDEAVAFVGLFGLQGCPIYDGAESLGLWKRLKPPESLRPAHIRDAVRQDTRVRLVIQRPTGTVLPGAPHLALATGPEGERGAVVRMCARSVLLEPQQLDLWLGGAPPSLAAGEAAAEQADAAAVAGATPPRGVSRVRQALFGPHGGGALCDAPASDAARCEVRARGALTHALGLMRRRWRRSCMPSMRRG